MGYTMDIVLEEDQRLSAPERRGSSRRSMTEKADLLLVSGERSSALADAGSRCRSAESHG